MGVNLVFLLAASKKWVLQAGDVSTAFLSGVNDFRALYLRPPKEGLEGVHQNDLLEMRKGVYGLCNAPRLWWRRLREVLLELGFVEMRMMQCVFMYWASDHQGNRKQLMGVLAVHVDDLIICGSVVFESVLARLKEKLTFGKWYVREFDYLGRHVKQLSNFFPKDRILKKQDIENRVSILAFSIDIWLQFSCPQVLRKISIFYHQNIDIH